MLETVAVVAVVLVVVLAWSYWELRKAFHDMKELAMIQNEALTDPVAAMAKLKAFEARRVREGRRVLK